MSNSSNNHVSDASEGRNTKDAIGQLKNRLIDILGKGAAGFGVASLKNIRAVLPGEDPGDELDFSFQITSSSKLMEDFTIEITGEIKDLEDNKTKNEPKIIKCKLVFGKVAKLYLNDEYDSELIELKDIKDEDLKELGDMLKLLERCNKQDAETKKQVKETESLKKSLEKLSQISSDQATRRKLQNHPTEANDGTTYSYEVTETNDENGVVNYDIKRTKKVKDRLYKEVAKIVFEPGKKTKGFLYSSDSDFLIFENKGKSQDYYKEEEEYELLGENKHASNTLNLESRSENDTGDEKSDDHKSVIDDDSADKDSEHKTLKLIDLVSGDSHDNGIGKYEELVRSIEQGKTKSKEDNTSKNNDLKAKILKTLGRGTFGGVVFSKEIEVNDFNITRKRKEDEERNFFYKITSSPTVLGGSSFSIERTISNPNGTNPVVTHNKLVFEKGKTAVGYVNKPNAGDDNQLSQITPENRREYELMLEILDRVNTQDTKNKEQLKTAAPLVKSLEGLVKKSTKNTQELSRLQILGNDGLVDIAAGTDTYRATKTVVGNVTTYDVKKINYNPGGEEQPNKNYRLILEPGKKARGFLDKTDEEVTPDNIIELTQNDAADTGINAFLSEVNPVSNGTRKSTLKDQVKATDPLKTSLEKLYRISNDPATRHKLQNHAGDGGENYSYEVTKEEVIGAKLTYTIKRTEDSTTDNIEEVYSKVVFETGKKTKGFLSQAEDSPLFDLIHSNVANVGTDKFLDEITKINQGKSAKKDDNKAKNDALKANLLTLLDGSRSKNIVVHNPDGTKFTYDISKEKSLTGDIFKLVKTENDVETSSKLEFDSKKTARGYVNLGVRDVKNMEPISDKVRDDYINEIVLFAAAKLQGQLQDLVKDGESKELTIDGNVVTISCGDDENGKKRRALKALAALGVDSFVDLEAELKRNHGGSGAHANLVDASAALNLIDGEKSAKKTAFSALNALEGGSLDGKMNGLFDRGDLNLYHPNIASALNDTEGKQELFHIKDARNLNATHTTLKFDANDLKKLIVLTPDNLVREDVGIINNEEALIKRIAEMSRRVSEYQSQDKAVIKDQSKVSGKLKDSLQEIYDYYKVDNKCLSNLPLLNQNGSIVTDGRTDSYVIDFVSPDAANKHTTTYKITKTSKDKDGNLVTVDPKKYSVYAFDSKGAVTGFTDKPDTGNGSFDLADDNEVAAAMKPLKVHKAATAIERFSGFDVRNVGSIDHAAMANVQNILNERSFAKSQKLATDKLKEALEKKLLEYDGGNGLKDLKIQGKDGAIDTSKGTDTYVVKRDTTTVKGKTTYLITKTHKNQLGHCSDKYSKYEFDDLQGGVRLSEDRDSEADADSSLTPLSLSMPKLPSQYLLGKIPLNFEYKTISKVDEISQNRNDSTKANVVKFLATAGNEISKTAEDGLKNLSNIFKSEDLASSSQVISKSFSKLFDESENKSVNKKRDTVSAGGKLYEYVDGKWEEKVEVKRSASSASITEGANLESYSTVKSLNIGDVRMAVSEAVQEGRITENNKAKAKMAVLAGIVKSVDDLSEDEKNGKLSYGRDLTKKEEFFLDMTAPSVLPEVVREKRLASEVRRGGNVELGVSYVDHLNVSFSDESDFSKAFMNRFASSTFEGCDLSSVGKNKMTFRHCTFGEGCKLPDDLSKISKNSFVNCKFSEKFLDGLGDRRDEFVERFGLHGGSKDGYLDNSPRSSVKEHEAVNLKQRSAGRSNQFI